MAVVELSEFVSRSQAARLLGVAGETIDQLARRGRLPFAQGPDSRLYNRRDLEALAKQRAAPAAPTPAA